MNRLVARQQEHNAQTRDAWRPFAEHRQQVTQLLLPERGLPERGPSGQRLCVLGAGNSNDLDLPALVAAFDEVHLVDLDDEALRAGVERQQPAPGDRIRLHGQCDLTGILQQIASWDPAAPPSDGEIQLAINAAIEAPVPIASQFNTVASVCLLSQLIHSVVQALGADHPRFVDLISAVRLRHLRLLAELTIPGGRTALFTDVVSSETCPTLTNATPQQLAGVVREAIDARNFFHGTNPAVIANVLRTDLRLSSLVRDVQFTPPWRWDLGPRVYAVYSIRWRGAIHIAAEG